MKYNMFTVALHMSVGFSSYMLYASDQNKYSDIDKNVFNVDGCIASPYKTEFVDSLSEVLLVVESNTVHILYVNAHVRTREKTVITYYDFENTPWRSTVNKVMNDRILLGRLPQLIYNVAPSSGDIKQENSVKTVVDNALIIIPENALFTLLQYTYGIKRNGEAAELLLSADGAKTSPVKPMLMKIINKYRSYEQ